MNFPSSTVLSFLKRSIYAPGLSSVTSNLFKVGLASDSISCRPVISKIVIRPASRISAVRASDAGLGYIFNVPEGFLSLLITEG